MALRLLDAGLPRPVRGLFTTAGGGADLSWRGPASSDQPASIQRLAAEVGCRAAEIVIAEQPHGAAVAIVDTLAGPGRSAEVVAGVDALVSRRRRRPLLTLAADCMPVLLADPTAGVIAAAHAGRLGLLAGVLGETVAVMVTAGAGTDRIVAVVGPCIGGCCYELPPAMVDAAERTVPGCRARTTWGSPSIDLRAGAVAVLLAAGVGDVRHVGGCTHDQPEWFYSYRRDRTEARHGGLVILS